MRRLQYKIKTQADVLKEVKKFYKKLYTHMNTAAIDFFNTVLPDTPVLLSEASELIDLLAYAVAVAALHSMGNIEGQVQGLG